MIVIFIILITANMVIELSIAEPTICYGTLLFTLIGRWFSRKIAAFVATVSIAMILPVGVDQAGIVIIPVVIFTMIVMLAIRRRPTWAPLATAVVISLAPFCALNLFIYISILVLNTISSPYFYIFYSWGPEELAQSLSTKLGMTEMILIPGMILLSGSVIIDLVCLLYGRLLILPER